MVPSDKLLEKPIALRHPFIFYFGHIPTFLDMKLSEFLGNPTEPFYFQRIFERGIDPDMEDPSVCHPHSEVPNTWPQLDQIKDFEMRVKQRLANIYRRYGDRFPKRLARILWMAYEHQAMHTEVINIL